MEIRAAAGRAYARNQKISVRAATGVFAVIEQRLERQHLGIALVPLAYYLSRMSVLTCKLPHALDDRLADLARRRGVPKSVLVREAIEAKIAEEAAAPGRRPANLIEALGDSVGSIATGKRDLARNKKHLKGYGR